MSDNFVIVAVFVGGFTSGATALVIVALIGVATERAPCAASCAPVKAHVVESRCYCGALGEPLWPTASTGPEGK